MPLYLLLRRLRREEEPTVDMERGRAFHKVLEHAREGEIQTVDQDGFQFVFDLPEDSEPLRLSPIKELKGEKMYEIGETEITLVGVVDAMNGFQVEDHKLTKRFDPERFLNALQWRCYLDMFQARTFVYNVFQYATRVNDPRCFVRSFNRLPMDGYPGMRDVIVRALEEFVEFVSLYIPERFRDVETLKVSA